MLVTLSGMWMEVRFEQPRKAVIESVVAYARYAGGYVDGGQFIGAIESKILYARHGGGNREGAQIGAVYESLIPNGLHTRGDGNGGQVGAVFEGFIPNNPCSWLNGIRGPGFVYCLNNNCTSIS